MKKRFMKHFLQILPLIILFFLSACQMGSSDELTLTEEPMLDIGDGGFLSLDPCGPPCFLNITPGITSQKQVFEILQSWIDLQNCIIDDETDGGSISWITCGNVSITFDNSERVENIGYILLEPISVGNVIAEYGNPDAVNVWIYKADYSYDENKTVIHMTFMYKNITTMIVLSEQEGEVYDVEPDTLITQIFYLVGDDWEAANPDSQLWGGFGTYSGEIVEPIP